MEATLAFLLMCHIIGAYNMDHFDCIFRHADDFSVKSSCKFLALHCLLYEIVVNSLESIQNGIVLSVYFHSL